MLYLLHYFYGDEQHTISGDAKSIWMTAHHLGECGIKFKIIDHYGGMIDIKKGEGMHYLDAMKPTGEP
jgi:hypothetical protein